jgi:trimeric autotransporter adhesin
MTRHRVRLASVIVTVLVGAVVSTGVVIAVATTPASSAGAVPSIGRLADGPGATTLAGDGRPGFGGDGGPANQASLDSPSGITEDRSGDLFIADTGNCRVREVPAHNGVSFGRMVRAGTIVTVAGGPCSNGANPPPAALAINATGDLFIAYPTANRVAVLAPISGTVLGRAVTADKPVTVAGTGTPGFSGDGGRATSAELDDPSGVGIDPEGDLLIADTANCRVRIVAASAGTRYGVTLAPGEITTVAGTGTSGSSGDGGPARQAQIWDPGALTVDGSGNVFVTDQGNRSVRVLSPQATTMLGITVGADDLTTVAGEGSYGPYVIDGLPAVGQTGELNFPTGLAVDASGNLLVSDGEMHVIRAVANTASTARGRTFGPGGLYIVAGAMSTDVESSDTSWIVTRMLNPVGLLVTSRGMIVYADQDGDVVRALPPGT